MTSAVAMANHNMSDTIEVKRNPIRIADVFVNGNQVDIDDSTISYLQFKGNIRREEMDRIWCEILLHLTYELFMNLTELHDIIFTKQNIIIYLNDICFITYRTFL